MSKKIAKKNNKEYIKNELEINKTNILDRVNTPQDLKKLPRDDLPKLAEDIRSFLIARVKENGGHLASNLGVVEMTIALLRVLDVPKDHIIWDVGHQSYVYKILTGRKDEFDTLRKNGGISGFPKRSESIYDCFGTGHSSTSLSAALGFAQAEKLDGSDSYTVAVIGDGAFTGGMIHEALNNCAKDRKMIIILNENEMSISKNIGRFANNLSKMRIKTHYFRTKKITREFIIHIPLIGKFMFKAIRDIKKSFKNILYGSNYFEDMGLYYLGPVDGNNEESMEMLLREAVKLGESVVIHAKTKKGCGLSEAEMNPGKFHGLPPVNITHDKPAFFEMFGEYITEMAKKDSKIVAITAAMSDGTGLNKFRADFPTRFFDVGIAEEHAITYAAGLAANGYRPIVPIYSTFLQRAYDNIIHDVALQKLPVVICSDRAGLNSSDGATHHGIFDVAFLSGIPNVKIYTPITYDGLKLSLQQAFCDNCPVVVRYPNMQENEIIKERFYGCETVTDIGVREWYHDVNKKTADVAIVTHGKIAAEVIKATDRLNEMGILTCMYLAEFIKPYDKLAQILFKLFPKSIKQVVFVEEEIKNGGFGMILSHFLSNMDSMEKNNVKYTVIATDEDFVMPKKNQGVYDCAGVSADYIVAAVVKNSKQ